MHKLLLDSNCSKQAHETVDKNLGISISVRKDQSAKIILPTLEVHIEPGAVDELVEELGDFESSTGGEETFEEYCSKEELNEQLDSTAAFSCLGYMGDDEGKRNARDRNGNFNKNLRKKFGIYPDYRIRLNGVKWRTLESSDEEDLGEDTLAQDEAYRGSRKSKRGKKRSNVSKSTDCDIISSEDEGDSEESEAVVVHIVAAKKKKMTKRRFQCDEVDTSASEASDVESLTDCSLCCNE